MSQKVNYGELRQRLSNRPLVTFYCESCQYPWIEKGSCRKNRCPHCEGDALLTCDGQSLDELWNAFRDLLSENRTEDKLRTDFAKAFERFLERQAEFRRAEIEAEEKFENPSKHHVYQIYKRRRSKMRAQENKKRRSAVKRKVHRVRTSVNEARLAAVENRLRAQGHKVEREYVNLEGWVVTVNGTDSIGPTSLKRARDFLLQWIENA